MADKISVLRDRLDDDLLLALRRNARASISELAATLGVARATVRARMERLEQAGEILGYTAVTRADAQDSPVRGLMLIAIEGRGAERVIARLGRIPEITAIHTTNGRWDVIVELGTETLAALDVVLRQIREVEGIAASETNLLLATRRTTRAQQRV
ncbi:MAG: Lrp/AsnC family transcriptional regulator [Pseudomonadota bacterium]